MSDSSHRTTTVLNVRDEFDLPPDRCWLNASHQGPLPRSAADRVTEMVRWKTQPHHLQSSSVFRELPEQLRGTFAGLIGASPENVVLGNSASYGLHLVANGLRLEPGDEVIVAANDFPSDILPWLRLEARGVRVHQLRPAGHVLTAAEVAAAMTDRTKVVCLTWVHSFSGHVLDLDEIGDLCRTSEALFVVNGSQGVGGMPITVSQHPIDVLVTVGFKWLCGPYGTGFCWLGPRATERVEPTKLYWLSTLSTDDLMESDLDLSSISPPQRGRHDVFGTANFFNNAGVVESIRLIDAIGVDRIHRHNLELARQLSEDLDRSRFEVMERGSGRDLSSIVFLRPLGSDPADVAERLARDGIDVAHRRGMLRVSPHLYNSAQDIERLVESCRS